MKKSIIGLAILTLLLQACATIVNGKFQDVNIKTTPPGAVARVGTQSCITPCMLNLYRKGADYISLTHGNNIETKLKFDRSANFYSYWFGNIIFLFFPGRIVDNVTGAEYTIRDVNIILKQEAPNMPKTNF
jgi:hypothetical protein